MSYLSSTNRCVKYKLQIRAREHLVLWRIQDRPSADKKDQAKEDPARTYLERLGNRKRSVLFSLVIFLFPFISRGGGWGSRGWLGRLSGW